MMFSLLVGIILLMLLVMALYIALGKLGVFRKVGSFTAGIKEIFEDKNDKLEGDRN